MNKLSLLLCVLVFLAPYTAEALVAGEGIFLDQNTGDYIITYANAAGRLKQSRFEPSTKISPSLRSIFAHQKNHIRYGYALKNGSASKQPIIGLTFDPISSISTAINLPKTGQEQTQAYVRNASNPTAVMQMVIESSSIVKTPIGWSCDVMPAGETAWSGYRVACSFDNLDEQKQNGLQIGDSISGFVYFSKDLPGVGIAQLEGFGDMGPSFVDGGPGEEIADQLVSMQLKDYVPLPAAVPAIAVPSPFDPAVMLDRIRTEMQTWPAKQLLDPAYAAQLDRYLVAAADAFRLNNAKAGKEHIISIRKMLAKEHHDLDHDDERDEDTEEHKTATRFTIDRLAARVLDFDLRYTLKQMEKDEEGESH